MTQRTEDQSSWRQRYGIFLLEMVFILPPRHSCKFARPLFFTSSSSSTLAFSTFTNFTSLSFNWKNLLMWIGFLPKFIGEKLRFTCRFSFAFLCADVTNQ